MLLLAAALMGKQMLFYRVCSRDAAAFYLPLAQAMAEGDYEAAQHVMIPPLYPIIVGLVDRFVRFSDGHLELAGQLVSAVGMLVTILLVYAFGRDMFSRRVGFAAAALTAVNPWIVHFGAHIGPVMLYAAILTGAAVMMVRYLKKPRLLVAIVIGLLCGLAAITRSEGIFMAPVATLIVLVAGLARKKFPLAAVHIVLLIAAATAVCLPRIQIVHYKTGYWVHDIRLVKYIYGPDAKVPSELRRPPKEIAGSGVKLPRVSKPPAEILQEAGETLFTVIGPATWVLAVIWLVFRKIIPTKNPLPHLILLLIAAGQLIMTAPVKFDQRYTVAIAPLVQVWAALGLVAISERLRRRSGSLGQFGRSIPRQMALLAVLLASLAAWSVLKTNVGTRHPAFRTVGNHVRQIYGPGSVLMAVSAEPAYYAQSAHVRMIEKQESPGPTSDMRMLADEIRTHKVDFIVAEADRDCWAAMIEYIHAGNLQGRLILKTAGDRPTYLIDAQKLAATQPAPTR